MRKRPQEGKGAQKNKKKEEALEEEKKARRRLVDLDCYY